MAHYKGLASELSEQIAFSQQAEKDYDKAMKIKAIEDEAKAREIEGYKA